MISHRHYSGNLTLCSQVYINIQGLIDRERPRSCNLIVPIQVTSTFGRLCKPSCLHLNSVSVSLSLVLPCTVSRPSQNRARNNSLFCSSSDLPPRHGRVYTGRILCVVALRGLICKLSPTSFAPLVLTTAIDVSLRLQERHSCRTHTLLPR